VWLLLSSKASCNGLSLSAQHMLYQMTLSAWLLLLLLLLPGVSW
jgi:hypothetical protein